MFLTGFIFGSVITYMICIQDTRLPDYANAGSIPFTPAFTQESEYMDKTWGYITKRMNDMKWSAENDVCSTPGCQKAARDILRDMNKHADPCEDFYEFACGNFTKRTKIPDDKTEASSDIKLYDKITEQLRVVMEAPSATDEARPYRMAKDLYRTCMDTDKIERIGLSIMKDIVHRMGSWPVLDGDQWDASKFTWTDTVYKLKDRGFNFGTLISFRVARDLKNNTKRVISLDQASLSLSRESLVKGMDDKVVQALYSYMVDIAVMFGADRDRATKELKESLDFEINLAEISSPPEKRRDFNRLYNPMTIPQLQENYPSIPWTEYLSNILPKRVQVEPNEVVIVNEPTYISSLENILSKTPKRTQANYMLRQAVLSAVPHLTENLRKLNEKFDTVRRGETKSVPRWKECVGNVYGSLTLAVGSLYVQRFVKKEVKKKALEIVDNVHEEMYKTLLHTDWMDEYTRKNALMKAKVMRTDAAYPDELLDVTKLEDYYEKLEITQENFLDSILNINKFSLNFIFGRLREPVHQNEWINHGGAATVNAFYNLIENVIEFPAGILQGGFFSSDRPNYMNYGAIGFVVGHEITHGFDDQGRQFDKDGNLVDWWAPETKEAYLKKAACIVNQYGNYTDKQVGQKLNGVNTQGENIADNGGIKLAYQAYNLWVAEHGTEKRLPGLQDFTPLQMFWISAANSYCTNYRPEYLKSIIVNDVHSPAEFRVRGPFSNRPEFSKDFNCPMGCKMNPPNKCEIW